MYSTRHSTSSYRKRGFTRNRTRVAVACGTIFPSFSLYLPIANCQLSLATSTSTSTSTSSSPLLLVARKTTALRAMSQLLQQAEPLDLSLRSPPAVPLTAADALAGLALSSAAAGSPAAGAACAPLSQLLQRLARVLSPAATTPLAPAFESLPAFPQPHLQPQPASQLWSTYLAAALLAQLHPPQPAAAAPTDLSALVSSVAVADPTPAQLLLLLSDPQLAHLRAYLSDTRVQPRAGAPAAVGGNGTRAASFRAPATAHHVNGVCSPNNGFSHVPPAEKLAPTKQLRVDCSANATWSAPPHARAVSPIARVAHAPAKRNGGGCSVAASNGNAKQHSALLSAHSEQPQAAVDEAAESSLEQTRQILSCLRCARAFDSLHELALHMIRSGHFEPNAARAAAGASPFAPPALASASDLVVPAFPNALAAARSSSPSSSQVDVERDELDVDVDVDVEPLTPASTSDNLIGIGLIPAPRAHSPLLTADRLVPMELEMKQEEEEGRVHSQWRTSHSHSLTPQLSAKSDARGVSFVRAPSCPLELLQLRAGGGSASDSSHVRPASSDSQFGSLTHRAALIITPQENSSCAFSHRSYQLGDVSAPHEPLSIVFERSPSPSPQATDAAADRSAGHTASSSPQPPIASPLASLERVCEQLRRDLDGLREAAAFRRSQSSRVSSGAAGASEARRTSERCNSCATDSLSDSLSSASFGQHSLSSLERFVYGFSSRARDDLVSNAPAAAASASSSASNSDGNEHHVSSATLTRKSHSSAPPAAASRGSLLAANGRRAGGTSNFSEADPLASSEGVLSDPLRSLQQLVDAAAPASASASQCQPKASASAFASSAAAFLTGRTAGGVAPSDTGATPAAASLPNATSANRNESSTAAASEENSEQVAIFAAPPTKRFRPSPVPPPAPKSCGQRSPASSASSPTKTPNSTRERPELPATATLMQPPPTARSLRLRCACGLCGKWFANKGQLRLHQSKLKCPVLQRGPLELAAFGMPPGVLAIPSMNAHPLPGALCSDSALAAVAAADRLSLSEKRVGAGNNLESLLAAIAAIQAGAQLPPAAATPTTPAAAAGVASPRKDPKALLESSDCECAAPNSSDADANPNPNRKAAAAGGGVGVDKKKKDMCARPALSVREASIARQFDKFAALAASRRV